MIRTMSLLYGNRVPEPERMEEADEVDAYAAAAASTHLARLDAECAAAVLEMNANPGYWLDLGCGPGQIARKVAARTPARIVAVDVSFNMLRSAAGTTQRGALPPLLLVQADASALPFRGGVFDLVFSNSVLHHLARPLPFLEEAARVLREGGKFFLRDLTRPPRWRMRGHLARHGRNYGGQMRRLFDASVRAAYTIAEARLIVNETPLRSAAVQECGELYMVIRRT